MFFITNMVNDDYVSGSSETWNVAKYFSYSHVLAPLLEARKLVKVALFGVEDINMDYGLSPSIRNEYRITALKRLLQELYQIHQDVYFVMNTANKNKMDEIEERLDNVRDVIDKVQKKSTDVRTKTEKVEINEELFHKCLTILRKVLKDIKRPLNDQNLIFPASEEFDLAQMKKDIVEGGG